MESRLAFIESLLRLLRRYDSTDDLFWDDALDFSVIVSDVFAWGTADDEPVTPESLPELERAFAECAAADPNYGEVHATSLYAARRRQMRPQGAAYPAERALWPLFDACGPEREVGIGNPYRPGEYRGV